MRAIRGECPPPFVIDSRLGPALDLVAGTVTCAKCGSPTLDMHRAVALPSFLDPELFVAGMRCRACNYEQAITLTAQNGSVVLGTACLGPERRRAALAAPLDAGAALGQSSGGLFSSGGLSTSASGPSGTWMRQGCCSASGVPSSGE